MGEILFVAESNDRMASQLGQQGSPSEGLSVYLLEQTSGDI